MVRNMCSLVRCLNPDEYYSKVSVSYNTIFARSMISKRNADLSLRECEDGHPPNLKEVTEDLSYALQQFDHNWVNFE